MNNKKAIENFFDTISEVQFSGGFAADSDELTIFHGIEQNAFKFKVNMKRDTIVTFVAYKKQQDYYLHSYNVKSFPLTKDEFHEYLHMLDYVADIKIVKTTENGKKPK